MSLFDLFRKAPCLKDSRIAELERHLERVTAGREAALKDNNQLREDQSSMFRRLESLSAPLVTKALTKLSFTCIMPEGHMRTSEFTLGPGRCGKTVERLELKRTEGEFIIKQTHTDHSHKTFTYKLTDIVGRVQECYETVSIEPGTKYAEQMRDQLAFERRQKWNRR
ncbi:hypothetical protein 14Stepyanka_00043 [Erwinia phage Stepyanka]|uniref:Uncharacterized protein n=1 Tax=Erwinia phage Stepyanka TaxID=2961688 RepID=A0A9E7T1R4_9CAUD|nr:hypothetical protein 14Stepyanka_00043 [Erwinia phage Stepyanka]